MSSVSKSTKTLIGVSAVAIGAGLAPSACSSSSTPAPSPSASQTSASASPSHTATPTFDGTVYSITDTARATIDGQKFASNSGVITISSDNSKIHVFAEGSVGFTLDMTVNERGQATGGTFKSNSGARYTINKGGALEFGGLEGTVLIATQKDIPVTPQGANGSLAMSLNLPGNF